MNAHLRIARPVADLATTRQMYVAGLGLTVLGAFEDHEGFDGVMLGFPGAGYHFEFSRYRAYPVKPSPTDEDLIVLYLPDPAAWKAACQRMLAAGFKPVSAFNPYWDERGCTFEDPDGYKTVLEQTGWSAG
jgi:catechol 2,3-dioxygenase-like lactoylglutathione lyase family enzyme